jgi:predicted Zn-dependent protease with MMP-like domain
MFLLVSILVMSVAFPLWMIHKSAEKSLPTEELAWKRREVDESFSEDEQSAPAGTLRYSEQEFQEMVSRALDEVPEQFDKEWENVAVIVSTGAVSEADKKKMGVPAENLVLGSYAGVDRMHGVRSQASRHIITIYQPALEQRCGADKEFMEREIRRVVLHELAHHLGMSHSRMREIGL